MTTHEVEKMLGITKSTLIYYEQEKMIKPKRDQNNYRNYSQNDIDILRLILLLRSMEISIDEIKLILNKQLSIRKALENKQEFIQKQKIELDSIEENIRVYIKKKKVYIVKNNTKTSTKYICLYLCQDKISFLDIDIDKDKIEEIDVSLCCSKGEDGKYYIIHNLYYVDLDIHTKTDTYSFQLMNNDMVNDLFEYLLENHIIINDPMNIINIYQTYKDPMKLNNYINQHFKEWAEIYHLDNPRENYYHIIKNDYMSPLNEVKNEDVPTIRKQFKEFAKLLMNILKKK